MLQMKLRAQIELCLYTCSLLEWHYFKSSESRARSAIRELEQP